MGKLPASRLCKLGQYGTLEMRTERHFSFMIKNSHFKEHIKTGVVNTQISTQGTSCLKIKDRNN